MIRRATKCVMKLIPISIVRLGLLSFGFEFRERASNRLGKERAEILFGPFRGGFAWPSYWSGKQYWPVQVAGVYEESVVKFISDIGEIDYAIDLGAAEGFYALNLRSLGIAKHVVAFEHNLKAQRGLRRSAQELNFRFFELRNNADENSVRQAVLGSSGTKKLLISDIEGSEYGLFSDALLVLLSDWYLAIELHDHTGEQDGALINRIERTHQLEIIEGSELSLNNLSRLFPDMNQLELANLAHEGRNRPQKWIVAQPRENGLRV